MDRSEAVQRLREARVGRLATLRRDGAPRMVPFVFAIVGEPDALVAYWSVDAKPKRRQRIGRLDDIETNPSVEFVVDGYLEDWTALWWVRVTGRARVVSAPDERNLAVSALADKYPQYREHPPTGPIVAVDLDRVVGWSAAPG
jgi:PPOX class probable F420-dependent enzyme